MRLSAVDVFDGSAPVGVSQVVLADGLVASVAADPDAHWSGYSLLPGLIDTHVHLAGNAGDSSSDFHTWPLVTPREEQVLHALAHAQRALRAGVTTVRDMAADGIQVAVAAAVAQGLVDAARVVAFGPVGMTAGHFDLFTPAALAARPPTADGPDACRALVRLHVRNGLDGIKIATSGGVLSVGDRSSWRNYTDDEIAAIVDEAHALGMRVAAHAHTDQAVAVALDHGVDSVEHATLISPAQADRAVAARVPIAPTLLINEVIAAAGVPVDPMTQRKAAELVERRNSLLADAAARGVRFVLGTDANGYHVRFGDQFRELARMSDVLGLSEVDALRAATSWAAESIGRGHELGRLQAGFVADALVVRGRPWLQLSDLAPEHVVAVILRGRVVHGRLPADIVD